MENVSTCHARAPELPNCPLKTNKKITEGRAGHPLCCLKGWPPLQTGNGGGATTSPEQVRGGRPQHNRGGGGVAVLTYQLFH